MDVLNEDEHEKLRLEALKKLNLLDTEPEERFDCLTALAQKIFDVPIAVISLVDQNRQWFKSRQGVDVTETPREISFCTHTIKQDEAMIVPDATEDPRFQDNPLVVGGLGIRFYAGAPLKLNSGFRIGTLCLIDTAVREFAQDQVDQLQEIARLIVSQIELRQMKKRLNRERDVRRQVEQLIEDRTADLYKAKTDLEVANRAKTEFLHNMSHELRTPLNAILSLSELILFEAESQLSPQHKEYMGFIRDAGRRLNDQLSEILALSQLEFGEIGIEPVHCDAFDQVDRVLSRLVEDITRARITASNTIPQDFPPFQADPPALQKILTAIISNAVKFCPADCTIDITARCENGQIVLKVRDNGPSVPKHFIERVFEPFFQVDGGLNRSFEGAGLGLTIARRLAQAHGGKLWLEETLGGGTTAVLELPRKGAALQTAKSAIESKTSSGRKE